MIRATDYWKVRNAGGEENRVSSPLVNKVIRFLIENMKFEQRLKVVM